MIVRLMNRLAARYPWVAGWWIAMWHGEAMRRQREMPGPGTIGGADEPQA